MLRKKLAVLLVAAMMLVMAASPAFAAPGGNGQGIGGGVGGGNFAHTDNGKRVANGGGQSNNPHVGCFTC